MTMHINLLLQHVQIILLYSLGQKRTFIYQSVGIRRRTKLGGILSQMSNLMNWAGSCFDSNTSPGENNASNANGQIRSNSESKSSR